MKILWATLLASSVWAIGPQAQRALRAREKLLTTLRQATAEMAAGGPRFLALPARRSEAYRSLEASVALLGSQPPDAPLMEAVLRLAAEIASADPKGRTGEVLLPLWKKRGRDLLLHSQGLEDSKRRELRRQLKAAIVRERKKSASVPKTEALSP